MTEGPCASRGRTQCLKGKQGGSGPAARTKPIFSGKRGSCRTWWSPVVEGQVRGLGRHYPLCLLDVTCPLLGVGGTGAAAPGVRELSKGAVEAEDQRTVWVKDPGGACAVPFQSLPVH